LQHLSVIQNLRPTIRFLTKEIGIAPDMVCLTHSRTCVP